jgi:Uma2 family endonuclease
MQMAIVQLKLGPADHGRQLTLDDFDDADFESGVNYEIIDGRLFVSTAPNPAENVLENWLLIKLLIYSTQQPAVINYVTVKPRVFVHSRKDATVPEPDIAAYRDFPKSRPLEELRWEDLSPMLVVEVLVEGEPAKDLTRNLDLYLAVPSIREYWVLDGRGNPDEPTLIQHRRYGKRWVVRSLPYNSTFTTKLLPGFSLVIDPRK